MNDAVNVHEAKTHLSRLLDRAHAGEEIILAKGGKPYARMVPLPVPGRREFGFLAGKVEITPGFHEEALRPLSEEELADWE